MTKNKKHAGLLILAIIAVLTIALMIFSAPANASEAPVSRAVSGNGTSGETEASVTFTGGQLTLLSAPEINFGSHAISAASGGYAAESVSPAAQVSDLRGNGSGWDLMVSLSGFELGDGSATLQGATITVSNPVVSAVSGTISAPPAAAASLVLSSDNTETPVMTAGQSEGMGIWQLNWNAADTKLVVKPGTAQLGQSTATLNWSLQSTP